ncbi:MAG: hypothetical protein A3F13_07215 [Gammaproteobacteria bacterium RIFCSPHIGHO2_12_FULL_40_19]|nr:MAG: hypothetical protein A3F13_07215 [Gammaproteobacteria bacterium RIFCSPHIGHO2_12_FULL_40_19]
MDSKVIQNIIHEILETGEYTLEGMAHHTRIPFDVIYDAACGVMAEFSITPWSRVVAIYLQVKPEISNQLMEWLLASSDRRLPVLLSTINHPL